MHNNTEGGNDQFTGGNNTNSSPITKFFYGDAYDMYDSARGGDDTLTGVDNSGSGDVTNNLYGDANNQRRCVGGNIDCVRIR